MQSSGGQVYVTLCGMKSVAEMSIYNYADREHLGLHNHGAMFCALKQYTISEVNHLEYSH